MDKSRDEKGNGLRNMSRRAAAINAVLKIQSGSHGTTICLNCKDVMAAPFLWAWTYKNSRISGKLKSIATSILHNRFNNYRFLKKIFIKISTLMGMSIPLPPVKRQKGLKRINEQNTKGFSGQ